MKLLIHIWLLLLPWQLSAQSSGAVLKVGLIWNDYLKDGRSIFSLSQTGTAVGLEVRFGAEDRTYFKLGGYYAKLHIMAQEHPQETQFFGVKNGFELIKAICGVETRLVGKEKFNWRVGATGAFNLLSGVKGDVKFEDINGGYFGLHVSTGVDITVFSIDISIEPGFENLIRGTADTKPVMLMLTTGFHF